MTKMAYETEDGKIALLNTANDECLWSGRWTNGRENNRFDELWLHKTKGGKMIFYEVYVTYWQGESNNITVLDQETIGAKGWLEDNFSMLSKKEIERLEELDVKLEETA